MIFYGFYMNIQPCLLGINIDHIATIRQSRRINYPDPIYAAFIAEEYGADSITVHLREDRRHIQNRDIFLLRKTIQTYMNLEIGLTEDMVQLACKLKPDFCCLVPESREEITTEGGLDTILNKSQLSAAFIKLSNAGIKVSVFIDPNIEQIDNILDVGISCIEIHTGLYSISQCRDALTIEFERIKEVAEYAAKRGLQVHAGHGLNYHNVQLIASLYSIQSLNIGHAVISRSLFCGLSKAVNDMKDLIIKARYKL